MSSLLVLDPDRTERLLPICLLDCEPQVRLLAAQHTPMTDDARHWLAACADTPDDLDEEADTARRVLDGIIAEYASLRA